MKYIVTGAAGFIGSNLVDYLLSQGKDVAGIDNFTSGRMENLDDAFCNYRIQFALHNEDIRDTYAMAKIIKEGDIVFHFAAIPSVIASIVNPDESMDVNSNGTLQLLKVAAKNKAKRMIFSSSAAVYGDSEFINKNDVFVPTNPASPYAASKVAGESLLTAYSVISDLEMCILRYYNIFGPRQNPNSMYSSAIPKFIKAFINNEQITVFGDGEQTRDFTHVSNVVQANWLAANIEIKNKNSIYVEKTNKKTGVITTHGTEPVFNIASGTKHSVNQLIATLEELFDKEISVTYTDPRAGEIKHSYCDIHRAEWFLGFAPGMNFKNGLKQTIKHIRENEV